MISRKRSYNHRLKSMKLRKTRKSIKKLSIGGRLGTGKERPCQIIHGKCEPRCIESSYGEYVANYETQEQEWKTTTSCVRKPPIYAKYSGSNPKFLGKNLKELFQESFFDDYKNGFSLRDIKKSGLFTNYRLKDAGYTAKDFRDLMKEKEKMGTPYNKPEFIKKTIKKLLDAKFTLLELKQGGFTATELKIGDLKANQLLDIGFTFLELIEGGYTAAEFKISEINAKDLLSKGITVLELMRFGYDVDELKSIGLVLENPLEGFNSNSESFVGWDRATACNNLRKNKFTVKQLFTIGFTLLELLNAGYNAKDFTDSGLTLTPDSFKGERSNIVMLLHDRGFTARNLKEIGFTVIELINTEYKAEKFEAYKNAGYNAEDFKVADITLKGLTPDSFKGQVPKILKLLEHRKFDLKDLDLSALINKGTVKDFFKHNTEIIKQYSLQIESFYSDSVSNLFFSSEIYLPIKWPNATEKYDVDALSNLIFIDDLKELKYTLKDDELTKDNLYNVFSEGLLTYGETKQKVKEIDDKLKGDEKKNFKKEKDKIDKLKEKCKFPLKNSFLGTHTNPLCRFKPKLNPKSDTSEEEKYEDINTNQKGI